MTKVFPQLACSLLILFSMSSVYAQSDFAHTLQSECQNIKNDARLGQRAYAQKNYQSALKHFKNQASWTSFCQANADETTVQVSDRDVEIAFNNVGLTYQKLGQNNWARAWFSIRPESKISQYNLKKLPALSTNHNLAGKYVHYVGFGEWNTIEVKATPQQYEISFSGLYMGIRSLIYGPNFGEFDTTMAKNHQHAHFQYEQCQLELHFNGQQRLTVSQKGESYDCGFGYNVSAEGNYLKVES